MIFYKLFGKKKWILICVRKCGLYSFSIFTFACLMVWFQLHLCYAYIFFVLSVHILPSNVRISHIAVWIFIIIIGLIKKMQSIGEIIVGFFNNTAPWFHLVMVCPPTKEKVYTGIIITFYMTWYSCAFIYRIAIHFS